MQETIVQGTTPVFSFTLPFETAQVKSFFVTFRQGKETVAEKDLYDCEADEYVLSAKLSQEETFLFDPAMPVLMQVRLADENGSAFASPVFSFRVEPTLKGGAVI